jgi:hypothetical protein
MDHTDILDAFLSSIGEEVEDAEEGMYLYRAIVEKKRHKKTKN